MSRTHKVAWAAGFVDGDGYIVVQRRKCNGYTGHYLRLGVNHVAIEPLLEMQKLFGGKIEKQNPATVSGNRKQRHRWTLSTKAAAEALKQMLPYMKNKQSVAALALDFQKTIGNHGQKVSSFVTEQREWFKEQIASLNSLD